MKSTTWMLGAGFALACLVALAACGEDASDGGEGLAAGESCAQSSECSGTLLCLQGICQAAPSNNGANNGVNNGANNGVNNGANNGGGDWPPPIDSLYNPQGGDHMRCELPACDEAGDAGFDGSGSWVRTLTTTESDCPDLVMGIDARTRPGNVLEDPPETLNWQGTCNNGDSGHTGTVMNGILASCQSNDQQLGVISYEYALIEFAGDGGSGEAVVVLSNLPELDGQTECTVRFDVSYARQ